MFYLYISEALGNSEGLFFVVVNNLMETLPQSDQQAIPTYPPLGKIYLNEAKTSWLDLDRDDPIYHRIEAGDKLLPKRSVYFGGKEQSFQHALHSHIQPNQMVFNIGVRYYAIPEDIDEFFAAEKHFKRCKSFPHIFMTTCQKVYGRKMKAKTSNFRVLPTFLAINGYVRCSFGGSTHLVHRLMMDAYHENFAMADKTLNYVVDHIDRDRGNNDLSNLQVVSQSENIQLGYDRRSIINSSLDICESIESATDIIWD